MRSSNQRIIDAVHTAVASVGLHSGCYARLDGLSKRVDLNGTVVRLTQWNKKKSRWIVEVMKFKNDTTLLRHEKKEKEKDLLRVKPTNLCAFIAPMLPLDATLSYDSLASGKFQLKVVRKVATADMTSEITQANSMQNGATVLRCSLESMLLSQVTHELLFLTCVGKL